MDIFYSYSLFIKSACTDYSFTCYFPADVEDSGSGVINFLALSSIVVDFKLGSVVVSHSGLEMRLGFFEE